MTTTPPPFDELVSAYLDGEATDAEVARVQSSPELMAEVRRLEELTALLGGDAIPAPPAGQREAHLAAALAAFDQGAADIDGPAEQAPQAIEQSTLAEVSPSQPPKESLSENVVSLDNRRQRRSFFDRGLGIAAAVALLVIGAAGLFALSNSGSDSLEVADTATDASAASSDSDASTDDAAEAAEESAAIVATDSARLSVPEAMAAEDEEAMEEEANEEDEMALEAAGEAMDDDAMADDGDDAEETVPVPTPAVALRDIDPSALQYFVMSDGAALNVTAAEDLWLGEAANTADIAGLFDRIIVPIDSDAAQVRTRCQLEVADLDSIAAPTLRGLSVVADVPVEIHQLPDGGNRLVVDARTCDVIDELDPGG